MKRVVTLFDGQNLFHAAKRCFGYSEPDYDPLALSQWAADQAPDRELVAIRFYTGIHSVTEDQYWHNYWRRKLVSLNNRASSAKVQCSLVTRPLKYSDEAVAGPQGPQIIRRGREKGIDVRLALDLVRLAVAGDLDVAVLFSQDGDLREAVDEVREIGQLLNRPIIVECAYPYLKVPTQGSNPRGIDGTKWLRMEKATYDTLREKPHVQVPTPGRPPAHPVPPPMPSAPPPVPVVVSAGASEEEMMRCLRLILSAQRQYGGREVWLSPFLKNHFSSEFPSLSPQRRQQLLSSLQETSAIRIVKRDSQDGRNPYSVLEVDSTNELVIRATSQLMTSS